MNKSVVFAVFFLTSFALLSFSLIFYSFLDYQKNPSGFYAKFFSTRQTVAYAALPDVQGTIQQEVVEKDARVEMVRQFFLQYGSPLEPFAQDVINSADTYNIDFRLIPAIAMQESNLCKKIIKDSYNCWGFGIYGKKVTRFKDYKEGIEAVTKTLAKNYKDKGLETPTEIMSKYTPGSSGGWANGVTHFMNQLQ